MGGEKYVDITCLNPNTKREKKLKKNGLRKRKYIVVYFGSCLAFPAVVRGWGILLHMNTENYRMHNLQASGF